MKYQNLVATTHRYILINPDGYDMIIYDEDIIWTSMEQGKVGCSNFESVVDMLYKYFEGRQVPGITKALKEFYDNKVTVLDLTELKASDEELQHIQSLHSIATRVMDNAIMGIFTADYLLRVEDGIIYGKRSGLPEKPSLVLSATANESIYKAVVNDAKYIDMGNAHDGGRLIQYLDKSYSRSYVARMDMDNLVHNICDVLENQGKSIYDYTLLTYSSESEKKFINALKETGLKIDEQTYFGNCSGYDHLKGKDIAILGTPNYPVDSYRMMALLIFGNTFDVMAEFETGKKEVNGFKKRYASFKDPTLQLIQKYAVETELLQVVGRARLLNNNQTQVLVLSGYPLNEADVVHYSGKTIIK
ncbi:MAG: hypothetical protein ACOYWZ_01900 [Bacillota bacterium]